MRARLHLLKQPRVLDGDDYAETFTDGATLLKAADRMGLEGIVSKKASMPYRSGSLCDWIKVKCPSWRERNRERWRLSER